jgi:hypothetical protein
MKANMGARCLQRGLLAVWLTACAFPSVALAQPTKARDKAAAVRDGQRVVSVSEVTIVGRVQKPIAAVDVSRIPAKLTLRELRQHFLPKVSQALYRAPF